eukprot:COSAG01_NODE_281_length_19504_cov_129.173124_13_plen_84_part_00
MARQVLAGDIFELVFWRLVAGAGNAAYLGGVSMYLSDIATTENRGRILGANHGGRPFLVFPTLYVSKAGLRLGLTCGAYSSRK